MASTPSYRYCSRHCDSSKLRHTSTMRKTYLSKIGMLFTFILLALAGFWALKPVQRPEFVPSLPGPVVALRLDADAGKSFKNLGRDDAAYFHSWAKLAERNLSTSEADRIRSILEDPASYGGSPDKCFEPECAFQFGSSVDVLVSPKCRRIQFVATASRTADLRTLSVSAAAKFSQLIPELLPLSASK